MASEEDRREKEEREKNANYSGHSDWEIVVDPRILVPSSILVWQ
jgi:hypothetical protein